MGSPQLSEHVRRRLRGLLGDDRAAGTRLLGSLREIRDAERVPACSAFLHLLAHVDLPEPEAEPLLAEIAAHQTDLEALLGRDPGLRVAAVDYLSNLRPLLRNATVIELSRLQATERSAITDALTGLYNRRHAQATIETEIRRSRRYRVPLALVMLDLDGFKAVNDRHGHPFGDQVLQLAGRVVRRAVRDTDIACRWGGDEFAVILPESDRLGAYVVAERIRQQVDAAFAAPVSGTPVAVSISGGVACYPEDGQEPAELARRADQALYRSKLQGRGRVTPYHAERRSSVRFPAHPRLEIRVRAVEGRQAVAGAKLINVSEGGVLVELPLQAAVSGPFEVCIVNPRAGGAADLLEGQGPVVRVEPVGDRAARRVAVRFETPLDATLLARAVRGAPVGGRARQRAGA